MWQLLPVGASCHDPGVALREQKKQRTAAAIEAAALVLFAERGYDAVTLADVAAAAGVADRTLYRYVSDKQELLFGEDAAWRAALGAALAARPAEEPPLPAVRAASAAVAAQLEPRRDELRRRAAVIAAAPALVAREAVKHAGWAEAITAALRHRGTTAAQARLAAGLGVLAFEDASARWLAPVRRRRSLAAELDATWVALEELRG